MSRGCLILIVIYAVAVYLEYQLLQTLPFAGYVAALLALAITLLVGSVQGLAQSLALHARPETDISQWRDGQPIRLTGELQAIGDAPLAPISDRPAVFCAYTARMADDEIGNASRQVPHWRGLLAVPCRLRTDAATLGVLGIPSLREVPPSIFQGQEHYPRAARHLANTPWQTAPELATIRSAQFNEWVSEGFSGVPTHLINNAALECLRMQNGHVDESGLLERLKTNKWIFDERVVAPGAEVTLVGTYRANPPAIDINCAANTPAHALQLGSAKQTATRQLLSTVLFIALLSGLAAVAHYAVYARDHFWCLAALRGLGLTD